MYVAGVFICTSTILLRDTTRTRIHAHSLAHTLYAYTHTTCIFTHVTYACTLSNHVLACSYAYAHA